LFSKNFIKTKTSIEEEYGLIYEIYEYSFQGFNSTVSAYIDLKTKKIDYLNFWVNSQNMYNIMQKNIKKKCIFTMVSGGDLSDFLVYKCDYLKSGLKVGVKWEDDGGHIIMRNNW